MSQSNTLAQRLVFGGSAINTLAATCILVTRKMLCLGVLVPEIEVDIVPRTHTHTFFSYKFSKIKDKVNFECPIGIKTR